MSEGIAVRYSFRYPDGKRGYKITARYNEPTGSAYIYYHDGRWLCAYVREPGRIVPMHYHETAATRCDKP
jgi:hypothetical protein